MQRNAPRHFGSRRSRNTRNRRWIPRFAKLSTHILRGAALKSAAASPEEGSPLVGLSRPVHRQLAMRAPRIELGKFGFDRSLRADQCFELRGGQGGAKMKSLILIATEQLQELELFARFHALRHDFQFQAMRKR